MDGSKDSVLTRISFGGANLLHNFTGSEDSLNRLCRVKYKGLRNGRSIRVFGLEGVPLDYEVGPYNPLKRSSFLSAANSLLEEQNLYGLRADFGWSLLGYASVTMDLVNLRSRLV